MKTSGLYSLPAGISVAAAISLLFVVTAFAADPPQRPAANPTTIDVDVTFAQSSDVEAKDKAADFRRKALDVSGVVPSKEAIGAYLADSSPDALPRALRRLLNKQPWSAAQATGAADTPKQGDFSTAWASRQPDAGEEWLALHFDKPVDLQKVAIYETYNPGAITKVTARNPQRQEVTLAEDSKGLRGNTAGTPLEIAASGDVSSADVLLYLNTALVPGWNEIDAVRLDGRDGTVQWAADASASSSYADQCPALQQRAGGAGTVKSAKSLDCVSCHAPGATKVVMPKGEGEILDDLDRLAGRVYLLDDNLQRLQPRLVDDSRSVDITITGSWDQKRTLLGVQIQDHTTASEKSDAGVVDGAVITQLAPGLPAEAAGLKKGDVIVRVNGIVISSATHLRELIGAMQPGNIVVIAYRREGTEAVVTATLAAPQRVPVITTLMVPPQGGSASWSPQQACKLPDTPKLGDYVTAWAPATMDGGREWLRLEYDRAVPISEVVIYQSYGPGAVSKVTAITERGDVLRLLETQAKQSPPGGSDAAVPLRLKAPNPGLVTRTITVELDTAKVSGWNEIDAVELIGTDGTHQWAARATASSYYGQPAGAAFRKAETVQELEQRMTEISDRLRALEERLQKINQDKAEFTIKVPDLQFSSSEPLRYTAYPGHSWSAEQACGAPNTPAKGDFPTAWAPATPDGGEEWLELTFEKAVEAKQLRVYESSGAGALRRVSAMVPAPEDLTKKTGSGKTGDAGEDQSLKEVPICEITGPSWTGSGSEVPVKEIQIPTGYKAAVFRIYLDTKSVPGWNEIDAVQLIGTDGSQQWARSAKASSSYYDRYKGWSDPVEPAGAGAPLDLQEPQLKQ